MSVDGAAGGVAPDDVVATMTQALQQLRDNPNRINAVSVKPATFWTERPSLWFAKLEAQFETANITSQKTKFNYVLQALDNATIQEVAIVAETPRVNQEYDDIKAALLEAFGQSQEAKDKALLTLNGLGDRKPTSLLRHIQSLTTDMNSLIKAFFLAQLPMDIRSILAGQNFATAEDMAKAADRIVETRFLNDTISSIGQTTSTTAIEAIRRQNTSQRTPLKEEFICPGHKKYGSKAYTCRPGCIFGDIPLAQRPITGNGQVNRR